MADEFDIVVHDVDEIDIDASLSDEIEITLSEVDDIEIMVFDYPAEIDLLAARVKASEGNASDAVAIAEQSATLAGEAVQIVGEHVENISNPHPTGTTQEFADTQITSLLTEATYTPTVWTYLVGLFTSVPKSVKEHIVKGWTVIQNLSNRVTDLENDIMDFSLTVTQNVASVEFTNLKIPKGAVIELTAIFIYHADVPNSVYRLELNNVVSGYFNTGLGAVAYINLYSPLAEGGQSQVVMYFSGTITAMAMHMRKAAGSNPTLINILASHPTFPDSEVNTLRIRTAEAGKVIAAGTKINLKVIK